MGFLDSIKKGFAMEDEDRPIPNTLDELVRTSGSSEAGRGRVIVVEPMRMEECNALVECIRHGLVVIINTEKLEEEFSRRIVDFLTGATRAIDGRSLKINRTTYIFAPSDIDVAIRRKDKSRWRRWRSRKFRSARKLRCTASFRTKPPTSRRMSRKRQSRKS